MDLFDCHRLWLPVAEAEADAEGVYDFGRHVCSFLAGAYEVRAVQVDRRSG